MSAHENHVGKTDEAITDAINDTSASTTPPPPPPVRSSRLVGTLGVAGAMAGLLLVFVFQLTQPAIQAHKAEMLRLAIREVLHDPDRFETLYVHADRLSPDPPAQGDVGVERVFVGYGEDGRRMGFAIAAGEPGFQDVVKLIFGFDATTQEVLGMKILESKETPGLGDKIEKDPEFVSQFEGAPVPLVGVKKGKGTGAEIDMITGATISSRAVIRIINNALEEKGPLIEAYLREVGE